ncbi:YlcI/YnfO family protein [Piscinibacter koreensis]|uniref:CopG family transcriptional regulator n=1 Tax=Piscinibacter koreensis TaxID=2742824 RepID=A0A7Y6NRX9_9BURK|nr:YlcI/YnfO family protein [Schlegelella koreensis]NUZ08077.1 hypothetical protein [Schlegelella koreensis]
MKTALIPQVRVEPELRAELESVLKADETLSEFVEDAVRAAVERRRVDLAFHSRVEVAWQAFRDGAAAIPGEQVFEKLQSRLDARREQLRKK